MICPSCKGTGVSSELGLACLWCDGKKMVRAATARRWVEVTRMLAGGGYIAGDHDLADMRRMEAEALEVEQQADREFHLDGT